MPKDPTGPRPTRRGWIISSLLGVSGLSAAGREPDRETLDDASEVAEIQARARRAGLAPFGSTSTEHYLGIGDAPDDYRNRALEISKAIGDAFQKHFQGKGFDLSFPGRRLTVITLAGRDSYAAFLGEDPGPVVGGHYDLDTNRLVIFDFRADDRRRVPGAEQINTFTLIHEAIHQLCFNTGLLDRQGDVPLCLSEGLATYGELSRPAGRSAFRSAFGQVNRPRLKVLGRGRDREWIGLDELLTDDGLLRAEATEQRAYAQSWLLVHWLLTDPESLPKFRDYLSALHKRRDPSRRIEDAEARLGDLDRLGQALKRHLARLI